MRISRILEGDDSKSSKGGKGHPRNRSQSLAESPSNEDKQQQQQNLDPNVGEGDGSLRTSQKRALSRSLSPGGTESAETKDSTTPLESLSQNVFSSIEPKRGESSSQGREIRHTRTRSAIEIYKPGQFFFPPPPPPPPLTPSQGSLNADGTPSVQPTHLKPLASEAIAYLGQAQGNQPREPMYYSTPPPPPPPLPPPQPTQQYGPVIPSVSSLGGATIPEAGSFTHQTQPMPIVLPPPVGTTQRHYQPPSSTGYPNTSYYPAQPILSQPQQPVQLQPQQPPPPASSVDPLDRTYVGVTGPSPSGYSTNTSGAIYSIPSSESPTVVPLQVGTSSVSATGGLTTPKIDSSSRQSLHVSQPAQIAAPISLPMHTEVKEPGTDEKRQADTPAGSPAHTPRLDEAQIVESSSSLHHHEVAGTSSGGGGGPSSPTSGSTVKGKSKRSKAKNSQWTLEDDRRLVDLVLGTLPTQDFSEYARILNKRDAQTVRYRWKVIVRRARGESIQ